MIIRIEPDSDIPIYIQLTNQIIEGIAKGDLKPGEFLPSVRAFAADLGVNMHTVNKSYHELEKKGIIEIVPKSGAVIKRHSHIDQEAYERLYQMLKPQIAEGLVLGIEKEELVDLIEKIINEMKKNS
ncbi:GntR family transcriptional regulator [Ureibacillus thermosphaericus]|uniref:GntR family transcriptional regulator n=1 Tax=Ureibacillus thermosphaericus TaxID=51173 RepID=A0A840PPA2_URETH|nr:GntR family transcriptional regulator [Ureibacillus thermosphaericus]MBB5148319.1 GntR family transcriptional regulator [Ureibacillus thermosphaericus]NKZ31532.1 GntR family transcriptional regulator [Ureibacillus thermosphaericus]